MYQETYGRHGCARRGYIAEAMNQHNSDNTTQEALPSHKDTDISTLTIQVPLQLYADAEHTKRYAVLLEKLPVERVMGVVETIQEIGIDRVKELIDFASGISNLLTELQVPNHTQA